MHMMIDIETLSTRNDATVLSIGAVAFSPRNGKIHDQKMWLFNHDNQGRHIEASTVKWWLSQPEACKHWASPPRPPCPDNAQTLREINRWVRKITSGSDVTHWWAKGPHFDYVILGSLYDQYEVQRPWDFWKLRDVRGLEDWVGRTKAAMAHDPLSDCLAQVETVCRFYARMMERK